ncbi:Rne/Rng family ribonuclease [Tessaracoccus oleiagri]|uniref:Ribonuclease E n=1 Tax=Tessaracoccus oleiagri TaxID=686624 RepID=A0A1G9J9L1_9ACTN|nr:Rne/Rng family ribonuclease [Tessaracoccus oleiagri]SDL34051.1 ribonuclease E [Tessaracoccus oleiagri]
MTDSVEPQSTTPAPRRRRAAGRPAGPPAEVQVETPAVQTHIAVADAPTEVRTPAEPRPTRRRATRRTAPAAAEEAVVVIGGEPLHKDEPAAPTPNFEVAEAPSEAPAPEPEAAPARRSRRRKAEPVVDEAPAAPAEQPKAPEADLTAVIAEAFEAARPEEERPGRRRRGAAKVPEAEERPARGRRRRPAPAEDAAVVEETSETTDADDDLGIEAAIAEAERQAAARRAALGSPFMSDEDRAQQLAALAGAIAGGVDDDDLEDEDDEDETDEEETAEDTDQADEAEAADDESETDEAAADDERGTRRRRRRGGRRRRRGGSADADNGVDTDSEETGEPTDSDSETTAEGTDAEDEGGDASVTSRRRRRRRRRSGAGDDTDSVDDEVTGIEGSTRMEAKRQRRKESRAAGRRRAPILSEAEFLARRESVDRKMIIRQGEEYTQLAVLEDNILVEHYVDRASATSLIGNIYLGRIQNVLPSMEAAFIDIGRGRNAVLYAGEVDWDSFGVTGENRKVENVLKSGQTIVVQVTKDPVGQKGARLTHHISLPGRYIVYSPGGHLSGISRKLPDAERARLRDILSTLISDNESVIVRTAAEGASEEDLVRDVNRLKAQWEIIEKRAKQGGAPHALYTEPDLTLRIVRDLFTEDFGEIVIQGDGSQEDAHEAIHAYVGHVAPSLTERVRRYEPTDDGRDIFSQYRIDEQIAKALDRKVFLPSGGSLVIDRTEAMTVIDVNTGRFTGSGGNLEATVTSNNLEAAEEIVRQLRLRDIGGIIVIDFIDMVLPSNRELLLRRLVECLGRDRTRHQVAEVTSLGLVQLTRKKIGTGLAEAFTEECEHCHGQGYVKYDEPVDSQAPADGGERRGGGRRRRKS